MKKQLLSILVLCCFALLTTNSFAQRFAYVDTKYILEKLPDYKSAQIKLDDQAKAWQAEIDQKNEALKKMYTKAFSTLYLTKYEMVEQCVLMFYKFFLWCQSKLLMLIRKATPS